MQIKRIVLYSKHGQVRPIEFHTGRVNIITGRSRTGKSALMPIIEYCLGSRVIDVPVRVIRDNVAWYAVHLVIDGGEVFIARREPGPGNQSSADIFIKVGRDMEIPQFSELHKTTNTDGLDATLASMIGLADIEAHVASDKTRDSYPIRFKHTRFFNYQDQGEIANKSLLFHRQAEDGMAITLRDVLPYFLGAEDEDKLAQLQRLRSERRTLRRLEREIALAADALGTSTTRATSLLAEAIDTGLVEGPATYEDPLSAFQAVLTSGTHDIDLGSFGDELSTLERRRSELLVEQHELKGRLREYRSTLAAANGMTRESRTQRSRLRSVDLVPDMLNPNRCPLCESMLQHQLPSVEDFHNVITSLDHELALFQISMPHLDNAIAESELRLTEIRQELRDVQAGISALEERDRELSRRRQNAASAAFLRGRISGYVETMASHAESNRLEERYHDALASVAALEEMLGESSTSDRIGSILSILSLDMTSWSRQLDLEYSELPLRIDYKRLTVSAETDKGPVTMAQTGSAANWLGFHLIAYAAMHKWFANNDRPVPRFLFLDQPTQAFYNAQRTTGESDDAVRVRTLYHFILQLPKLLNHKVQIIVTDHENREEPEFREAVVENWHESPDALIPASWLGR